MVEKTVEKTVEVEAPVEKIVEKIVEVEVPVEKVAIKEVPVEIVRKEIVYVPLYSTEAGLVDASAQLKGLSREVEDEVPQQAEGSYQTSSQESLRSTTDSEEILEDNGERDTKIEEIEQALNDASEKDTSSSDNKSKLLDSE